MKSKEEILNKKRNESKLGYSISHEQMIDAMQEYAAQETAAIQAEQDEYRKALIYIIQESSGKTKNEICMNIAKILDKYPQQ